MRQLLAILLVYCNFTFATGLTIHAAEIGVGKFHRYDNQQHPYGASNAWTPFILADNADLTTPKIVENADHSITIFFSTLEELLQSVDQVASEHGQLVESLNINAHGLPGGMWYPVDADAKNSFACSDWNSAASADDKTNYDQYYSPVSKEEIDEIAQESQSGGSFDCVSGLPEWQKVVTKVASVKARFSQNAEINVLSCSVGMGPVGEAFANGIAALLLSGQSQVKTILQLGLGDWSLPEGLSFWDYQNDQQLDHDNQIYPVDRQDREIKQNGTIRVSALSGQTWGSTLLANQEFLRFGANSHVSSLSNTKTKNIVPSVRNLKAGGSPNSIRIVGTQFKTKLSTQE